MKVTATEKPRGRPREFSYEKALEAAMRVFWKKGYDGASLSELTTAMGINRPSMYSTFGNKESLFLKTMEHYEQTQGRRIAESLATGTAREGVQRLLRMGVTSATDPKNPGGCFGTQGSLTSSGVSPGGRRYIAKMRAVFETALRERFDRAVEDGELPHGLSSKDLAGFYSVVFRGLVLQAKAGGTREELLRVVNLAMSRWPSLSVQDTVHELTA